ncbi:MAG: bacterial/archaeal transporter family protein [Thermosediminibacterales bacterium]|nr:bacterial/archaeal transporter family protein [Thermosediminibacterales bacterium]
MTTLVFALLTMLFWGTAPIFGKIGLKSIDPLTALTIRSFSISLVLLIITILTGKLTGVFQIGIRPMGFLVAEGLLGSLIGHFTYFYALKYGEASKMVPITAAFPMVTVLAAIVFLNEKFTLNKLIGTLFIMAGILIIKSK